MELFEYIDPLNQPFDIFYSTQVNSPIHWHYHSEILYVISGRIKVICNDQTLVLDTNDICYIYPLQLHGVLPADDKPSRYGVIKFDIHTIHIPDAYLQHMYDYFVRRTRDTDKCICIKNFSENNEFVTDCIEKVIEEYQEKKELYMLQIQSHIYTILISIMRGCGKEIPEERGKHADDTISFYNVLEYIDSHSSDNIEIRELADMCHMSYSHFARLFRDNYGRSCKEYIKYIRLNKAEEMLIHTDYDVAYIANEVGFFDSSQFIKAYKSWKGTTPKQQRMLYSDANK